MFKPTGKYVRVGHNKIVKNKNEPTPPPQSVVLLFSNLYFGDIWYRCGTNIDPGVYSNNTKSVHVGKNVATQFSGKYADSRETNNIHSVITLI